MATAKLVTAPAPDSTDPARPAVRTMAPAPTDVHNPVIGMSIDEARVEIDDAFADIKTFHNREPDEIMRLSAGHSARLSEIRVRIMRVEDYSREWRDLRQRELEPTLEELARQWSHGSRLHSVRELDWKMESGER